MLSASGSVYYDGSTLDGTFTIDGSPRYITVDVKPPNRPFECSNATITFEKASHLSGPSNWRGRIGRDDFRMSFDSGVSIVGPLAEPRLSSDLSRGAGTWSVIKASLPVSPRKTVNEPQDTPPVNDPVQGAVKAARERDLIASGVPIVVIFGQSGAGKSTFINLITAEKQRVGIGLQSCTSRISVIEANICGRKVVIIDTPGIDDTRPGVKETDILISIAKLLEAMGKHKVWVTGVLYLHRITDNRFTQTADRVSSMLRNLCGDAAMSHVMLCTTMWDSVPEEKANERFDELIGTGAWKEMIARGASTARISNTSANAKADAEEIVAQLIKNVQPIEMAIQDEMVNQGKTALQTGAGVIIEENELKAQDDDREQPAEAEPSVGTVNEVPPFVHDPHAGPRDTAHNDNKTFREQGMQTSGDPVIVTLGRSAGVGKVTTSIGQVLDNHLSEAQVDDRAEKAELPADAVDGVPPRAHDPHVDPQNTAHNDTKLFREQGIQASEISVITTLGESGAGKSTDMNASGDSTEAEVITNQPIKDVRIEVIDHNEKVDQKPMATQTEAGQGLNKPLPGIPESESNAEKVQEEIGALYAEVAGMTGQPKEQARTWQQFRRKLGNPQRRKEDAGGASIVQKQPLAYEAEITRLKQQLDELERQKYAAKQFKKERKNAERVKGNSSQNAQEATPRGLFFKWLKTSPRDARLHSPRLPPDQSTTNFSPSRVDLGEKTNSLLGEVQHGRGDDPGRMKPVAPHKSQTLPGAGTRGQDRTLRADPLPPVSHDNFAHGNNSECGQGSTPFPPASRLSHVANGEEGQDDAGRE